MSLVPQPDRRSFIATSLAAASALSVCPRSAFGASADDSPKKLLFFTKSSGFEHDVVRRKGTELAYAERIMVELGKKHGLEVHCSKDGQIFDNDYKNFDAYFFYTTGDLTQKGTDQQPGMSAQGKKNLLDAISGGKGFIGSHCASDTFHTSGEAFENQSEPDPYIQMIGGEFIRHGRQQPATMRVASENFPGVETKNFRVNEEWYSLKNFAPNLHVILVQETEGMVDDDYKRPPYPATWARAHGQGRVFYTSMGHREDVWTNETFQSILLGGIDWTLKRNDFDPKPNLKDVCPQAMTLPVLKR